MMILLSIWMSAVFDGARSSSKITLAAESISAVLCILLGLVHPGLYIKLSNKLLVFIFILFSAGVPHKLLGTHHSFQVAPTLVSLRFMWCCVTNFL